MISVEVQSSADISVLEEKDGFVYFYFLYGDKELTLHIYKHPTGSMTASSYLATNHDETRIPGATTILYKQAADILNQVCQYSLMVGWFILFKLEIPR